MSTLKKFFFNGDPYFTKSEFTVSDLVTYFNHRHFFFILEYNHKVCEKKYWDKIFVKDQDRIEIVTIVGGG